MTNLRSGQARWEFFERAASMTDRLGSDARSLGGSRKRSPSRRKRASSERGQDIKFGEKEEGGMGTDGGRRHAAARHAGSGNWRGNLFTFN